MIPSESSRESKQSEYSSEPVEKMIQWPASLQGRIDQAKGLVQRFQREFRDLDDEERRSIFSEAYSTMRIVVNDVLSYAVVKGEYLEVVDTLRQSIATIRGSNYEADMNRILKLLLICQAKLIEWNLILTFQPIPSDFAARLWDEMIEEAKRDFVDDLIVQQHKKLSTLRSETQDQALLQEIDQFTAEETSR